MILTVTLNPAIDKTILVENFSEGNVNRVLKERNDAGGKGINVSRVIKELGGDSVAVAFTGGYEGEMLKRFMDFYEIELIPISISGAIRTNVKLCDNNKCCITDINSIGPEINSEEQNKLINEVRDRLKENDIVIFSGSAPGGIDSGIYKKLIEIANDCKAISILDADGELLIKGIAAKPFLIKPNIHELQNALNRSINSTEDIVKACRELVASGINNVFISMGEKGCIFVNSEASYFMRALSVQVKNTVGAGDSLVAGLAYGLSRGYEIEELLRLSVACAAAACTMEGTEPGKREDIEKYSKMVEITRI